MAADPNLGKLIDRHLSPAVISGSPNEVHCRSAISNPRGNVRATTTGMSCDARRCVRPDSRVCFDTTHDVNHEISDDDKSCITRRCG
jgi:hypothetical protein